MSNSRISQELQSTGKDRKKAPRLACATCHIRKIRCDAALHGLPCTNCRSQGKDDCHFHVREKRGRRPLRRPPANIRPRPDPSSTPTQFPDGAQDPSSSATAASLISPPNSDLFAASTTGNDERPDEPADSYLADLIDQEDIEGSQITYRKRLYYIGTESSNLNFLIRQRQQHRDVVVHHFPSRQLPPKYTAHERDRVPADSFILPDKPLADKLIEAYFTHINTGFPVVDEDQFMKRYSGQYSDYPSSLTLTQAILLVGAHVSQQLPDRDDLKRAFFRRAKTLLDARYEQDRTAQVQCALLLTWHSDGAEDIGANAWYWVGYAARIALGLGMHRDASRGNLHLVNKRVWRRVWWLLFQYDVFVSISYGRPQAIRLEEADIPFLEPRDFEGITNPQIDYVIQRTQLCIIMAAAAREVFGLRSTPQQRRDAVLQADRELSRWSLQLPVSLQPVHGSLAAATLHFTYHHFLILLHRPRPGDTVPAAATHTAHDANICSNAASKICLDFEYIRATSGFPCVWLTGTQALFTAIIQVSVEQRSSNRTLAQNAQKRFNSIILSLQGLSEYWLNAASVLRIFEARAAKVKAKAEAEAAAAAADATCASTPTATPTTTTTTAAAAQLQPPPQPPPPPSLPPPPPLPPPSDSHDTTMMEPQQQQQPPIDFSLPPPPPTGPVIVPDEPLPSSDYQGMWPPLFPADDVTGDTLLADAAAESEWRELWTEMPFLDSLLTEDLHGHWFGDL